MFNEKPDRSSFHPVFTIPIDRNETDMPSRLRHLQEQIRTLFRLGDRIAFGSQKRIVLRIDKKSRDRYRVEIRSATALPPVILRIAEAVKRRGVAVIELPECPHPLE